MAFWPGNGVIAVYPMRVAFLELCLLQIADYSGWRRSEYKLEYEKGSDAADGVVIALSCR